MEVETKLINTCDYERQIFQEILPFYDANDEPKDGGRSIDYAVQAVKRDPAVLEVVTQEDPPPTPREEYQEPATSSAGTSDSSSPRSSSSSSSSFTQTFEQMVLAQRDALLSLSPQQMELLLGYVDTLRRQRMAQQRSMECAFCKNNGEPESWYSSHALKDWRGRIRCPVLRSFRCPRCGATGNWAHTIKYCPENNDFDRRSNSSSEFGFF